VRRTVLWAAAAGGVLLVLAILSAAQERRPAAASKPSFEVDIPTAQEVRAMLGAYGQRVEEGEKALAELRTEMARSREAAQQALAALADAQKRDVSGLEQLLRGAPPAPDPAAPARFRAFDFADAKPPGRAVHIPAGSFGEATLLTGAFAPTTGEPLPVLLRLEAALVGPQRTRVPIRGAFLVGKAQGDANSARAVIQLDTVSLVRPDGRAIDAKVNGWVSDADGVQGVRGTYVWRASEIAALAATAGALGAAADATAARETLVQSTPLGGATAAVTGDPLRYAGFRAAGGAAEKIAEIVARRLQEITPAVHVPGGRRVTVAFIGGVTLEGLAPEAEGEAPFRGLDLEK